MSNVLFPSLAETPKLANIHDFITFITFLLKCMPTYIIEELSQNIVVCKMTCPEIGVVQLHWYMVTGHLSCGLTNQHRLYKISVSQQCRIHSQNDFLFKEKIIQSLH